MSPFGTTLEQVKTIYALATELRRLTIEEFEIQDRDGDDVGTANRTLEMARENVWNAEHELSEAVLKLLGLEVKHG